MQRDQFGNILYEEKGSVEKYYPNNFKNKAIFWSAKRLSIHTNLDSDKTKQIIGFKYCSGPHKAIDTEKTYEVDNPLEFPNDVKEVLNKIDITTNCFGYVFTNGLCWIDPVLDCFFYKISVIENILQSDNYVRISSPVPNSIALFSRDNSYWHVSKTNDGITWFGKNGVYKPAEENLAKNIEDFGDVSFFIKTDI